MPLKSYRDLDMWKRSMELVEEVYRLSRNFPSDERFGMIAQIRDAVVSVPGNIAEGYGRLHRGDYVHHLSISSGSLAETETLLILAVRLEFVARDDSLKAWNLAQETGKMLHGLISSLRQSRKSGRSAKDGGPETQDPRP